MASAGVGHGPLKGLHVLEIAHFIAGPHAAMMLGDHGATVIKVEPLAGEQARHMVATDPYGNSLFFACHNRGKRAVALNLGHPEAARALDPLLEWADVVITNYALGVPERLGFGRERLSRLNPRAILVHITGFGSWSEWRDYLAFDGVIQATGGLSHLNGSPDGPPLNSQVLVADHSAAAHAANAALCALFERSRTGSGGFIEVGMLEVMTSMLNTFVPDFEVNGEIARRYGQRPFDRVGGSFRTCDGFVMIAPVTPKMWKDFCALMGHPEWTDPSIGKRPSYVDDQALRKVIDQTVEKWMATRTMDEAMGTLQALGIASGMIRSIERIYTEESANPHSRVLTKVHVPNNPLPISVPGRSFQFENDAVGYDIAPALNADTFDVLAEIGVAPAELDALEAVGVIVRSA